MFTDEFFDYALDGAVAHAGTASLHTGDPGSTGSNEVSGGGYTRQSITWGTASDGIVETSSPVTFNVPGDTTVYYVGLWDGATFLGYLTLESPETFSSPGTLEVTTLHIYADNP